MVVGNESIVVADYCSNVDYWHSGIYTSIGAKVTDDEKMQRLKDIRAELLEPRPSASMDCRWDDWGDGKGSYFGRLLLEKRKLEKELGFHPNQTKPRPPSKMMEAQNGGYGYDVRRDFDPDEGWSTGETSFDEPW